MSFLLCVSKYVCAGSESNELQLSGMSGEMPGYSVKEYAVFIRKYNPDVVMLQEIDYNTKEIKFKILPLNWLRKLGFFSVFWESYGNRRWRIWSSYTFKVPLCLYQ